MRRTFSRIKAMFVLYRWDLIKNEYEDIEHDGFESLLNEEGDLNYDVDFFNQLVNGVKDNIDVIDRYIAICLTNYSIDRLSYIDRAIIRLATYELKYTDTSNNIIINEYVDLSHEYSEIDDFNSAKFNNAILDKISKRISDGR